MFLKTGVHVTSVTRRSVNMKMPPHTHKPFFTFHFLAIKEERFRFGSGYDQVEDILGVAQPVRFNSERHSF